MRQFDKHALSILVYRTCYRRVLIKVSNTKEADSYRPCQAEDHPGHTDTTRMDNAVVRVCRHKTRQDVRLPEVTQPPAHQRDNGNKVQTFEHINVFDALLFDHFQRVTKATDTDNDDNRCQDQGKNHQAGLYSISPAHREETANKGVKDRRRSSRPQSRFVAHAKGTFKQTRACHNARSAINGEEQQNNQRGDNAQNAAFIFKAPGEIIRQG